MSAERSPGGSAFARPTCRHFRLATDSIGRLHVADLLQLCFADSGLSLSLWSWQRAWTIAVATRRSCCHHGNEDSSHCGDHYDRAADISCCALLCVMSSITTCTPRCAPEAGRSIVEPTTSAALDTPGTTGVHGKQQLVTTPKVGGTGSKTVTPPHHPAAATLR